MCAGYCVVLEAEVAFPSHVAYYVYWGLSFWVEKAEITFLNCFIRGVCRRVCVLFRLDSRGVLVSILSLVCRILAVLCFLVLRILVFWLSFLVGVFLLVLRQGLGL